MTNVSISDDRSISITITPQAPRPVAIQRPGVQGVKGDVGKDGKDGKDGSDGADGNDGLSAYDIAVINGFEGSEEDWLASLVGPQGEAGGDGSNGWMPILAVESDGERRVQKVVDWVGGTGTKPEVDVYVGADGFVETAAEAVNIRGSSGAGTGDMETSIYDPNNVEDDAFDMDNMVEGSTNLILTQSERNKLAGIEAGADVSPVTSVAGKSGDVTLDTDDISGLGDAALLDVGTTSGTVAAGNHSHSNASTSASGFMSATDKAKLDDAVTSDDVTTIVVLTQAGYDLITSPDADTLYIIKE